MYFELITIDLDGTLVDSVGDLHEAVNRMQNALGEEPATVEQVQNWVGNGVERLVHRALTQSMDLDADDVLFHRALTEFSDAYEAVNGTRSSLYPGVLAGLEWLASLDTPMIMITNKAGRFARPLLKRLAIDQFFDHQICGDDVAEKKPDPSALLLAARYSAAVPRRSVLIGDSVSDIRAARAAGFASVAVSYGYNHGQSVREGTGTWRPDAVIDSFEELPAVFKRLVVVV